MFHSEGLIFGLHRCVLSALLGMTAIAWYTLGGQLSDEEIEYQVLSDIAEKSKRKKFFKRRVAGEKS
jgi:iron transport multicopper oxidase